MSATITAGSDFNTFKNGMESGGTIVVKAGTYNFGGVNSTIQVRSGSTITFEKGAMIKNNNPSYHYTNSGKLSINVTGSNITINGFTAKGKVWFTIGGSNHNFNDCLIDQSADEGDPYQVIDGSTAAYLMQGATSNTNFRRCTAKNTWHHGFDMQNSGPYKDILFENCNAISCGSGLETVPFRSENSRWATGFDTPDAPGAVAGRITFRGCYVFDSLQSGFHIDGAQNINGFISYDNCLAENCGRRLLDQWIRDPNNCYQSAHITEKTPPWDYYASGWYVSNSHCGDGVQLTNCKSKGCARVGMWFFESTNVTLTNCEDEGSTIGFMINNTEGVTFNNVISRKARSYAMAIHGSGHKVKLFKVVQFGNSGHKPIITGGQYSGGFRKLRPNSEMGLGANNLDLICAVDHGQYSTNCRVRDDKYYKDRMTSQVGCSFSESNFKVDNGAYASASGLFQGNQGGSIPSANVSTFTPSDSDMIVPKIGTVPSTPCNSIDCLKRVKKVCDSAGNITEVSIAVTDPDYIAWCGGSAPPTTDPVQGNDSSLQAYPSGSVYLLNKSNQTKIYARDFAIGGKGNAYNDASSGNSGSSSYRSDSGDVDLVDWGTRINEPDSNKVVVAYTENGDWLKYPVKVEDNGTYTVSVRASNGTSSTAKLLISVAGEPKASIDITPTGGYEKFQTFVADVVVPYIGTSEIVKVEFDGDINLFWFQFAYKSANGAKVREGGAAPVELTQSPYNTIVIRSEYGYTAEVHADWYDYGGEGKAYHNVSTARPDTYRRGIDAIELSDDASVAVSTGEWLEYTLNIAEDDTYYLEVTVKDVKEASSIKFLRDGTELTKIDLAIVDGNTWVKVPAPAKVAMGQGYGTVFRLEFTGDFLFKSFTIKSSATVENKISAKPFRDINIGTANIVPVTLEAAEFDYGGQGISYMDDTKERFMQKPVRDSDVDVVVIGKAGKVFINNTVQGEWVQYTINNNCEGDFINLTLTFNCSTTNNGSKLTAVFINEKYENTYNANNEFTNKYILTPPRVAKFTEVQNVSIPVKVYKGKNTLRVYFDNDITMGDITFSSP